MKQNEVDKAYRDYKKATNMTYTELLIWSKKDLSQMASLYGKEESETSKKERKRLFKYVPVRYKGLYRRFNTAQIRNLVLLKTPKSEWDNFLVSQARKAVSYLKRAKKIKGRNYIDGKRITKNTIALRNWAYDRYKK